MSTPNRYVTLFNLRFAARVLERHCRLWRRIDAGVRLMALLAGSGAIAAIGAANQGAAITLGGLFALFQAVEFALRPADIAAKSMRQRKAYASLSSRETEMDDVVLAKTYDALTAEDEIVVPEVLRRLAYNDVACERTPAAEAEKLSAALYRLGRWDRFVECIA